jgi:hypothetical protein
VPGWLAGWLAACLPGCGASLAPAVEMAEPTERADDRAQVRWWGFALQDLEFTRVSYQDLSFTMASILFVPPPDGLYDGMGSRPPDD